MDNRIRTDVSNAAWADDVDYRGALSNADIANPSELASAFHQAALASSATGPAPGKLAPTNDKKQEAATNEASATQQDEKAASSGTAANDAEAATDAAASVTAAAGQEAQELIAAGMTPENALEPTEVAQGKLNTAVAREMDIKGGPAAAVGEAIKARYANSPDLPYIEKAVDAALSIEIEETAPATIALQQGQKAAATRIAASPHHGHKLPAQQANERQERLNAAVAHEIDAKAGNNAAAAAKVGEAIKARYANSPDLPAIKKAVDAALSIEIEQPAPAPTAAASQANQKTAIGQRAAAPQPGQNAAASRAVYRKHVADFGHEIDVKAGPDAAVAARVGRDIRERTAKDPKLSANEKMEVEKAVDEVLGKKFGSSAVTASHAAPTQTPAAATTPPTPSAAAGTADNSVTQPAQQPSSGVASVDDTVKQLQSAKAAIAQPTSSNPYAPTTSPGFGDWSREADAEAKLKVAVKDEIAAETGGNADDARVAQAGQKIVARYASDPTVQKVISGAVVEARSETIVARAQTRADPSVAVQHLSDDLATAPADVKDAVLQSTGGKQIIHNAAAWANEPLTRKPDGPPFPLVQIKDAMRRLDQVTQGDKTLAGAVALDAVQGYEQFQSNKANLDAEPTGSIGREGMSHLALIAERIGGTSDGDKAVTRFAAIGFAQRDGIGDAVAAGAKGTYVAEVSRQGGVDDALLTDSIIGPNKTKVDADVKALAEHSAELAWLVDNDGKGMTDDELQNAIAKYPDHKGETWKAEDARLRQQLSDDGTELIDRLMKLQKTLPAATFENAMTVIVKKDPSASLAISTALKNNPDLAKEPKSSAVVDFLTSVKIGDLARKYTGELASSILRSKVLDKLKGIKLSDPESVQKAKQAIESLRTETFAKLIGVSGDKKALDKAVNAVQKAVDEMAACCTENAADMKSATVVALKSLDDDLDQIAMQKLSNNITNDASIVKAFAKNTLAGQMLRGVAVVLAAANAYGSASNASDKKDVQSIVKASLDAVGFAQRTADLGVGLGTVSKTSLLGKFGGEWKIVKAASMGELIMGVSAALDAVSAIRSFGGLGVPQDTTAGIISATSAVGGMMSMTPALGAAAWAGPVGLGIVAVSVAGKIVYQGSKDAHKFEHASKAFLKDGGYSEAAAEAFSKQGDFATGVGGTSQMPFLAQYAKLKGKSVQQLQAWANNPKLTPDQLQRVSMHLLQTAGDCDGDPSKFTNGPAKQTIINTGGPFGGVVTVANTREAFEDNLRQSGIPLL